MPFSVYNLSFGIVHLYVGWVTTLTRFSDIWHCTLKGLVLSFEHLGLVFPLFRSPFTPSLHYSLSHKTTLTPWDLMFASTYFIWRGSVHWLKYRMSADLRFLRIPWKGIMLSPFGLLTPRPRSKTDDVESLDYRGHLCLLLWHIHTRAYPLSLHDDVSSYMYTCNPLLLEMFGINAWTYSTFSLDSSYSRVLPGLAWD